MKPFARHFFSGLVVGMIFVFPLAAAEKEPVGSNLQDRIKKAFSTIKEAEPVFPKIEERLPEMKIQSLYTGEILTAESLFSLPFGPNETDLTAEKGIDQWSDREDSFELVTFQNRFFVLDKKGPKALEVGPQKNQRRLFMRDGVGGMHLDGWAIMAGNQMAFADNQRHSVFLFRDFRFFKTLGMIDDRLLFQHIQSIFSNESGNLLGAYDSAKNKGYVFDVNGSLLWECEGPIEPAFYGNRLLRMKKTNSEVQVQALAQGSNSWQSLFSYSVEPNHLVLDAWVVGVKENALVLVIAEGLVDEDHPAASRVVVIQNGEVKNWNIPAQLDLELLFKNPYGLWNDGSKLLLLQPDAGDQGIDILGFPLK